MNIVRQDIASLLDGWIEAERNGVQFPVPLHDHWNIAGHSTKQDAFKLVESRQEAGFDFLGSTLKNNSGRGRKAKAMFLTVAALERLCLAAHTSEGDAIRELYRQSKAKWDLVQQVAPAVAQEVEVLAMKIELAKIEAQKAQLEKDRAAIEDRTLSFRHLVVNTMPEVVQQKILGYELVEKVEYRDRVIVNNQVVDDGDTINKTELCDRYNIKTRNGAPDFKRLNALLDGAKLPPAAWEETTTIRSNMQLRRDWLDSLDRHIIGTTRQLHVGE